MRRAKAEANEAAALRQGARLQRGIEEKRQSAGQGDQVRKMVERLQSDEEEGGVQIPRRVALGARPMNLTAQTTIHGTQKRMVTDWSECSVCRHKPAKRVAAKR